jgi:hypothetical protein
MNAMPAAILTAVSAVLVFTSLAIQVRRSSAPPEALLTKAAQQAEAGRKMAIYDRETSFFALWYVASRCDEECYRSVRYKLPFSLLVVEPAPGSDETVTRQQLVDWISEKRRRSDMPGCLAPGRFVMLMPETDMTGAQKAATRLLRGVPGAHAGLALHPWDGGNFEQLIAAAKGRLGQQPAAAAESRLDSSSQIAA